MFDPSLHKIKFKKYNFFQKIYYRIKRLFK